MIFLFPLDVVLVVLLVVVEPLLGGGAVVVAADVLNTAPLLCAAVIRPYNICCILYVMTIDVEKQPEITQHSTKIQFMSRRAALQEVTKGICEHLRNPTPYRRYLQFPYNVSWTASLSFSFSFSSEI